MLGLTRDDGFTVKTMQRMMVEKGVCTATEFSEKVHQIDLEDGRSDGRSPF